MEVNFNLYVGWHPLSIINPFSPVIKASWLFIRLIKRAYTAFAEVVPNSRETAMYIVTVLFIQPGFGQRFLTICIDIVCIVGC